MPGVAAPIRKRAGQRRILITFYESDQTKDTMGGQPAGEFTSFGTDYAAIDEIPFIVNATEHGMLYNVTVRYRADVVTVFETEDKRVQIVGGGKTLNLLEIENPERRNVELILHCAVA